MKLLRHRYLSVNMNKLTFITLNVRGLKSSRKRRAIFRQLHVNKYSIIFLQETYMCIALLTKKNYEVTSGVVKCTSVMEVNTAKE